MPRTLLSVLIGLSAFVIAFFAAQPDRPLFGITAGVLFLVIGQCLLPRDPSASTAKDWLVRASMVAPLVAILLLGLAVNLLMLAWGWRRPTSEEPSDALGAVAAFSVPCIGVLLGGILARWLPRFAPADAVRAARISRLLGYTAASLFAVVFVTVLALDWTEVAMEHAPGNTEGWKVAVIHVVLVVVVIWRILKDKVPISAATVGFLMAVMLVDAGLWFVANGPAMGLASIPYFVCAAMDLAACGCCVGVSILRLDVPPVVEGSQS